MTPKRVMIETTLYGKRLVLVEQLFQLHREVSKAASLARLEDERWQQNYAMGKAAARRG